MNAFDKTKAISFEDAKVKVASYCAYQERCQQEVRDKLYGYGFHRNEVEKLVSYLITEGFINELRFVRAYAGGKFRIKKWGKVRIAYELKLRKVSEACIKKGFEEISEEEYILTLNTLINKKFASLKGKNTLIRKKKVADYFINKGYERALVWDRIKDYR